MSYYADATWAYGTEDCEPPEPDKRWLTIRDDEGEEVAIVVQRKRDGRYRADDSLRAQANAEMIAEALNEAEPR